MLRTAALALAALVGNASSAQRISLDWPTPTVPANNGVKVASTGGVFSVGTGENSAVLQRISAAGAIQWTKTLSAPTVRAIDMDVYAADNIYIYLTFETGQLDLDPGPNTTLGRSGQQRDVERGIPRGYLPLGTGRGDHREHHRFPQ